MANLTYKDIAKIAKVSVSTVSRYYNNGYVGKKTKTKIEEVIKKYDFYPNHGARLIRGQNSSIYIIVPEHFEGNYNEIVEGIEASATLKGKHVFVTRANNDTQRYIEKIKYIISWKPGAIILFLPVYNQQIADFLKANSEINFVVYGYDTPYAKWVKYESHNMFYNLVKKFYHKYPMRKLVLLVSDKLNKEQINERRASFKKAVAELDIIGQEYLIDNRNLGQVGEFLDFIKKNNIYHVVCTNHESFINVVAKADSAMKLHLTDIGYQSIYDYNKKYKLKIFIDYSLLGIMLERQTDNKVHDKNLAILDVEII